MRRLSPCESGPMQLVNITQEVDVGGNYVWRPQSDVILKTLMISVLAERETLNIKVGAEKFFFKYVILTYF